MIKRSYGYLGSKRRTVSYQGSRYHLAYVNEDLRSSVLHSAPTRAINTPTDKLNEIKPFKPHVRELLNVQ